MKLGVNIDHIAVLREARLANSPQLLYAVNICELSGANQITIHLREDRRHIQNGDVEEILAHSKLPVNLECSLNKEIIDFVCKCKPFRATIVPENRREITTEGGLDLVALRQDLSAAIERLQQNDIEISLFIEPKNEMINVASELKANGIELHTGRYASIYSMLYSNLARTNHCIKELDLPKSELEALLKDEIQKIQDAASHAKILGLAVAAGHGLDYQNVSEIAKISCIGELNIGQSIVARSVFTGLADAVKKMARLVKA